MLKPIKTKSEYKKSLKRIYELMHLDLKPNMPEFDELDLLSLLIEHYEERNFPIASPDPIEAIKFRMEQMGLSNKDLVNILGSKSRVSEILSKKRKLSLQMIRSLHNNLNIPAEALITDY
ncbi:MAG: transcriptional regulator [Ignavibacteriales bacterium]|nr:transcriptional regulator [Ignavibacteriales bacterium]